MPSQFDSQESQFKGDRRARKNTRLWTQRKNVTRDPSSPRARDRPVDAFAFVTSNAHHFKSSSDPTIVQPLLRPDLRVLRQLAYCCWERSRLLDGLSVSRHADALVALSAHWRDWLRPLDEWHPEMGNADDQFANLLRHLLARYDVPRFLDAAWRAGLSIEGLTQQEWFKHIGRGENIRTADDLPIPRTRRMAHHFLQVPEDIPVPAAFRFAQVLDLGGDDRLARSLVGTRIGTCFEANDFWDSVIRWLIEHPEVTPVHHGPLIDYLHDQKFVPSFPLGLIRGHARTVPPRPHLSMGGRSAGGLLRSVERWHRQLAARRGTFTCWKPTGMPPLVITEVEEGEERRYTITELISSAELEEEGTAMGHCVASYRSSCICGHSSIWSLTVEHASGRVERLLTLEVHNWRREIIQARGRFNRMPEPDELCLITRWTHAGGPSMSPALLCSADLQ